MIFLTDSGVRASDTLDFRPRVGRFTQQNHHLHFQVEIFQHQLILSLTVTPQESSLVGYEHYLPRIDRVILDKNGVMSVIKGVSSVDPKIPVNVDESMHIATISLPAYLYDVQ